jgi:transcriptional regulator with XRE-family HTH domain
MIMITRFKSLLESLNLSPSEFADSIGVQRSSVSHVLSGRNKPSIDFLEKILIAFPDTDSTWLITGRTGPQKASNQVDYEADPDRLPGRNTQKIKMENTNPPAPLMAEPVDHVIIVYKDNTFRILNPSEK